MRQIFINILRLILYLSAFCLLTSSSTFDKQRVANTEFYGTYSFKATGDLDENMKGKIHFENIINETSDGDLYSTLIFKCIDNNACSTMQFLMCKKNTSYKIQKGSYNVSRNFDSLLNYFDGVFGFANLERLGEMPFFAKEGKIRIIHSDDTSIKGELNISLKNNKGDTVHLEGDFIVEKQ